MSEEKKTRLGIKAIFQQKIGSLKGSLRDEQGKEILTYLLFVGLAFLFWIMLAIGEDMNAVYRIPIKYTHVPDNTIVTGDLPEEVIVHLRDEGVVLMNYNLEGIPAVEVNFGQYANNRNAFMILPDEMKNLIKKNLKNTTNLTSVSIDTLAVYYTQADGKQVKVRVDGSATTVPQCIISGKITSDVETVQVYAPEYMLKNIHIIETDSFVIKDLSQTTTMKVALRKMPGVKLVPEEVVITIPVEELTVKTVSIPVTVESLPSQDVSLHTFPAEVKVECMVPISRFSTIAASDIGVAVDYDDTKGSPEKLAVRIVRSPGAAHYMTVVPDSVEYVLIKKQ